MSSKSETLQPPSDVKKTGYLRKLKTMKKKFFVLKTESENKPARLEYYDNEKKWKLGAHPKRSIILKTCFNINRKLDTKHKHALALYTKDDCFTIILDNDDELEAWLRALLELQQGDAELENNEPPKPSFEHIWQVNIRNRGLASTKNILGSYHLCLTSQVLSLVKLNTDVPEIVKFPLMSIRRCGHSYCFFFMELGRSAVTGAGELWMQTEDVIIAQNMHEAILNAMRSGAKEEITPRLRTRSSSTNESSKPITVCMRRQTTVCGATLIPGNRERSDSVPSRPQNLSDSVNEFANSPGSAPYIIDSCGTSVGCEEQDPLQFDFFPSQSMEATSDHDLPFDEYLPMTPPDTTKGSSKSNEHADDGYMDMASPSSLPPTGLLSRSRTPSTTNSPNVSSVMATSAGKGISLPLQPDYLEMVSPTSNSPADSDGYMQMSPLGSSLPNVAAKVVCSSGKSHRTASTRSGSGSCRNRKTSLDDARKTSLDESNRGRYIPMVAVGGSLKNQMDGGYLQMSSVRKSKDDSDVGSPAVSEASSADLRFSEFQLEKVTAYFSSNEEEEEKLVRAYSVGSKTAATQNKSPESHLDASEVDSSRVRAFSVGSKVGLRFGQKKVDPAAQAVATENKDKKSQSAPLLGGLTHSWSGTSLLNVGTSKPKQNEDLMELDFARYQKPSFLSKNVAMGKRNDDIQALNTDRTASSMHPRSSSRSSTCPAKGETLQVIGERSYFSMGGEPIQHTEASQVQMSTCKHGVDQNVKNFDSVGGAKTAARGLNLSQSCHGERHSQDSAHKDALASVGEYVNVDMNRQLHRMHGGLRLSSVTSTKHLPTQEVSCSKPAEVDAKPTLHGTVLERVAPALQSLDIDVQKNKKITATVVGKEAPSTVTATTTARNEKASAEPLQISNSVRSGSLSPIADSTSTAEKSPVGDKRHVQLFCEVETPYENVVCCTKDTNVSRPSSVSSESELNYASLDLAAANTGDDSSTVLQDVKSGSPTEAPVFEPLSYASIDFKKSEGLRHTSIMRESKRD